MSDNVNHPAHYTQYKHEVIELTSLFDFCTGNALKYLLRFDKKGGAEDLRKAKWYLEYALQHPEVVKCLDPAGAVSISKTYKNPLAAEIADAVCCKSEGDKHPWKHAFALISSAISIFETFSTDEDGKEDPAKMMKFITGGFKPFDEQVADKILSWGFEPSDGPGKTAGRTSSHISNDDILRDRDFLLRLLGA